MANFDFDKVVNAPRQAKTQGSHTIEHTYDKDNDKLVITITGAKTSYVPTQKGNFKVPVNYFMTPSWKLNGNLIILT